MFNQLTSSIANVWNDKSGATAIEYGLIAGLVAVVIIGALTLLGTDLQELFAAVSGGLDTATAE